VNDKRIVASERFSVQEPAGIGNCNGFPLSTAFRARGRPVRSAAARM